MATGRQPRSMPAREASGTFADASSPPRSNYRCLSPGREDPLQGDIEVERHVRLHVVVGLAAADWRDGVGTQARQCARGLVLRDSDTGREQLASAYPRRSFGPVALGRVHCVRVCGYFALEQSHRLASAGLAKIVLRETRSLSRMHDGAALDIREREGRLPVASVGRPKEREESGVLR